MQARRLNNVQTADILQAHTSDAAAATSNSLLMLRVREMQRWYTGTSATPDQ